MLNEAKRAILVALIVALAAACVLARERVAQPKALVDATLKTVKGKDVSLAAATQGRVCIVKFGATWCGPCTMQLKEFDKLIKHYGDKVRVIDIDMREAPKTVVAHYIRHKFRSKLLLDLDGSVAKAYGVGGIPHSLVVGADGKIALTKVGVGLAMEFKTVLDKLLAEAKKRKAEK